MAEGIADCMPLALRSVGDAIRLDSENRTKEAYCQYLSCVIYISQVLKDDAWDKDPRLVYNNDTAKLFRLLQQCQERALTIISSFANGSSPSRRPNAPKLQVMQRKYSDSNALSAMQTDQSHSAPQFGAPRKLSESTSPGSTLSTPSTDGYLHLPSPPGSPMPHHRRTGSYDPLDKAYQENKQLLAAYRARIQNANKGKRNQGVTSKNLSLMRRMSENLVIAKAREEAIKKKLLERQQRLQEETNRRFGPVVLFTKEQQEQRVLYTKILEFEQETVWPKHLREKLKLMPTDAKLIKEIITKIFCSADHPLTQFLLQYQYYVYRKLAPLVKDVGFPDVKSGRKASSQDSDSVLSETPSDSQQPTERTDSVHVDEGDKGESEQWASSLGYVDEDKEEPSSESLSENTLNKTNKVERNKCEEEGDDNNENSEVMSGADEKNFGSSHESGVVSSTTDLERLKNLLDEDVSSDTSQTGNVQVDESRNEQDISAQEETVESTNLESYFQELEDEMFDWESSGDERDENEKESIVGDNGHEMANDESLGESKEGSCTETKSEEGRTKDPSESVITDEATSRHLNSSEGKDESLGKETSTGDTDVSEQMKALREGEAEPQNLDTDKVEQPTEGDNTLEANPVISEREEQCIDGQTSSRNNSDEGEGKKLEPSANEVSPKSESSDEASPTPNSLKTPDEEKGDQVGINDQGGLRVPKLPPLEESSDKNKQGDLNVQPQSEEVRKQLKDILVDVRFFLEKLQKLLILAYEPLDTAAGRDLCYSCVEFPFFKPLWPVLLAVLRQVNYEKEVCLADVMAANISKGPLELGIAQRLCLEDQEERDSTGNKYPYQPAVEELHKVVTLFCPLEKLECLVRTSRCICQCVEDYWESKGKPRHSSETAIGCDDLLPILSFVIIRSGMAQLVSECDAMEEFIPAGYLMGEEGYCLTTLLTALAYLATLKST